MAWDLQVAPVVADAVGRGETGVEGRASSPSAVVVRAIGPAEVLDVVDTAVFDPNLQVELAAHQLISRSLAGGSRSWRDGRIEAQGELAYLSSADDNAGMSCDPGDPATCYGSATTGTLQASGVVYWRLADAWFANASLGYGRQAITLAAGAQPTITSTTGFLRVGYRF